MRNVYLDANATTKIHPECAGEMLPFLEEVYGNASSVHAPGREAKKHVEKARARVAGLICSDPSGIIFTSGGTESNNLAIKGTAYALADKGKHIITSSVEHDAVINTCKYLEKEGFRITYLGVNKYGEVDLEELTDSIGRDTILISVMAANNETGTIMPIGEIGRIAEERDIVFHTDAVQMAGKMSFDVNKVRADLVSIAAHKLYGPKGVGALYVKKGVEIEPCMHGAGQEGGKRAGTENVPGIVGLGKACEFAVRSGIAEYTKVQVLRDMLLERLESEISRLRLNGHPEKRLPNTLNVSFDSLDGESVVQSLDMEGVAVSTGAACSSGSPEPSVALKSMGLGEDEIRGAVRFSLHIFNTEDDIDYVMEKLPPIISRLRETSKMYGKV